MRRRRGPAAALAATAILCVLWFVGSAEPAHACSCIEATDEEHDAAAEVIFIGRATAVEELTSEEGFAEREYTVRVARLHKGEITDPVRIRTAGDSAACGVELRLDTLYKLLPYKEDGTYWISSCGGNRLANETDLDPPETTATTGPALPSTTTSSTRPPVTATTGLPPTFPTTAATGSTTTTSTVPGDEAAVGIGDEGDGGGGGGGLLRTVGSMAVAAAAGAGVAVWRQRRIAARPPTDL